MNGNFASEVLRYVNSLVKNGVEENDRKTLLNNHLDIYIPSKKLAIECNELCKHGEVSGRKDRNYHRNKLIECNNNGITLIQIMEDEWVDKPDIVKSKICHLLGIGKVERIFARNCKIRELRSSEKRVFLNDNHVQGDDKSQTNLGLWNKGVLVAVMTFCKHRAFIHYKKEDKKENEFELSRYAALKDYSVVGGAGKLLSYFIKNYKPAKILSYADRRWSVGNLYEKIGFARINDGTPNYWYFGRGQDYKRYHRFGFAKHTLANKLEKYDPNLTEWENMTVNGWDRIWDCGSIKYEMAVNYT